MTKSTKSHLRGLSPCLGDANQRTACIGSFPPLKKHPPRARVSRASHAWQVRAAKDIAKVGSFAALRGFNHTTRANIAHEEAEQIRARIACTPAEKRGAGVDIACALTGWSEMFSFIAGRRFVVEWWFCSHKTGNFAHVEKRGKIINNLWKSLLKTLFYNGFRVLLFQGGKKAVFRNSYKNHRKTRHFSLFPIKRENLH